MISIFAKPTFLNVNSSQPFVYNGQEPKRGHLMRVSSMIRGDQIADAVGAKFNPESGYENDVCIYVKPHLKKDNMDFKFEGRKSYIDIIDGHNLGQLMIKYPKVGVIVCSKADEKTMGAVIPNEIVFIPQHHCNFKRETRWTEGGEVTLKKIGMIGTEDAFDFIPKEIEEGLKERGIELIKFSKFFTREDIINFYKSIDLQMIWRPYRKVLSNPLKIVNASSFGIATIAYDEEAFKEVQGCYWGVNSPEQFLAQLDILIEHPSIMLPTIHRCIEKAEFYHIDNVAKMYKELDK